MDTQGISVELYDIDDIVDMNFGRVDFLSDENYSVEIKITASSNCAYVVPYLDYHQLSEARKADVSFESMSDELCYLQQKAICCFRGNVEIIVMEKMKLEELSIHMQYLQTEESPIAVFTELTSAEIVELLPYGMQE